MNVTLSANTRGCAALGILRMEGLTVARRNEALFGECQITARAAREKFRVRQMQDAEELAPARELFKKLHLDPSHYRPSSESLLRRVVKGTILGSINTVVDINNQVSLETFLPMGVYDAAKIQGDVEFRLGRAGESYEEISREVTGLEDKPLVSDAAGPFGSPLVDSARTMITPETKTLLQILYVPKSFPKKEIEAALARSAQRLRQYNGGTVVETAVVT